MRLVDAPSSLVWWNADAVTRVRELARLPTLTFVDQPGPRAISGPPRVSDTLVVARSRANWMLDVQ